MSGTALALFIVPTFPILQCAILTPFSGSVSPLSPEFLPLLLVSLPKSKDEVPPSGVSW